MRAIFNVQRCDIELFSAMNVLVSLTNLLSLDHGHFVSEWCAVTKHHSIRFERGAAYVLADEKIYAVFPRAREVNANTVRYQKFSIIL